MKPITLAPDINGNIIGVVPLTQDQHSLIDLEDVPEIGKYNWGALKGHSKYKTEYYARRNQHIKYKDKKQITKTVYMHRVILNPKKDLQVDHVNGNSLDNRKSNLRLVNNRQNAQNRHHSRTSKYPGVSWYKSNKKWASNIEINGKTKHLGYFDNEIDAANAYQKACSQL